MLKFRLDSYNCEKCRYAKIGTIRGKCKTCYNAYTLEYKVKTEFTKRGMNKIRREASDKRLETLYQRIKEKYFDGNYVPESQFVLFTWKKGHRTASWCAKNRKEIRMGGGYKAAFNGDVDRRHPLVNTMIHEAVHLRLPHHRKNFWQKVNETQAKVQPTDLPALFEGLL